MTSKTVITYGTFDLFHIGHLNLLERLSALGDKLIVGVSTDEFNSTKGKKTIIRFEDRLRIVKSIRCVSDAFAEDSWDQKPADIQRYGASIFAMGDDWTGKFDFLQRYCKVLYLPRTQGVSSTEIKQVLRVLDDSHIRELKQAIDILASVASRLD